MKVFAILVFAIASVSALGSGPYLPSGWKPKGPAFYLPSETQQKTEENSLKDVIFQESEASSSDFLQEYGPPKNEEVIQDITKQNLPDVATEQAFSVIETRFNGEIKENRDTKTENAVVEFDAIGTEGGEVAVTESQVLIEEKSTDSVLEASVNVNAQPDIQGKSINIEIETAIANTEDAVQTGVDATERGVVIQETGVVSSGVIDAVEGRIEQEVKTVVEGVKNIEEAIINIKNEESLQTNSVQDAVGVRNVIDNSGSLAQAPEGFLEYGPPGFREYGPPKEDIVPLSAAVEGKPSANQIESNETRRRRFSPKLRTARKH
ncbi:uncharacterized protein LOC113521560 [Galleria mellonella]|uniref:Uncharacterized protein LOC113521560 n=1 Tax=Galleria mellonella TaxID=7137 RepID=A0A6J3BXD5_GALME|nr:uncharacterized protein LOC113521560 [Galleria mellonella]